MNKEHFLIELKIYLRPLSKEQKRFFLEQYETIFNERMAAGESEELIAKDLGKPMEIAEHLLKEFGIKVPGKKIYRDDWYEIPAEPIMDTDQPFDEREPKDHRPLMTGWASLVQLLGILCLNGLFVFWIILTMFMLFFAAWLVACMFILSPALVGIQILFIGYGTGLFQLFLSIFLFGVGIIGVMLLVPLTKLFIKGLKRYCLWTFNILRGGN